MNYLQARNAILRRVPGPHAGRLQDAIREALRSWRIYAAQFNTKGWPFLLREITMRNEGGYEAGSVAITQDSRTATLTGGTWPTTCVGWFLTVKESEGEVFKIASRTSDTVVVLDRPYEGESVSGGDYIAWDPYCIAPADLMGWKSIRMERVSGVVGYEDMGYLDQVWPNALTLGDGVEMLTLAEPTKAAQYDTGTVTIAKADATVTLSGGTWPEWCVGHHLRFMNETALYKIASRTDDTNVELDRDYGGNLGGSARTYALDPPGAVRLEIRPPQEDQFTLKVRYWCQPEELVNDTDLLEGPQAYQEAILDLVSADVLTTEMPAMPPTEAGAMLQQQYMAKVNKFSGRGNSGLSAVMGGTVPPAEEAVLKNVRYA